MGRAAVDTFDVEIRKIIAGSGKKVSKPAIESAKRFLERYSDLPEGQIKQIIKDALTSSMDTFDAFDEAEDGQPKQIDHNEFGRKVILKCTDKGIVLKRVPKDVEQKVKDEFAGSGKKISKKAINDVWGAVSLQRDLSEDDKYDAFTEALEEANEYSSLNGDGKFSPKIFGLAVAKKIAEKRADKELEEVLEDNNTINYDGLEDSQVYLNESYNRGMHFDDFDEFEDFDDFDYYEIENDGYDNASGKRKAKRAARKAKRKENRADRRENRADRKQKRQERKQSRVEARQTRKATRKQGRLDRKRSKIEARMDRKMMKAQGRADRKAVRKGLAPAAQTEQGMSDQVNMNQQVAPAAVEAAASMGTPTQMGGGEGSSSGESGGPSASGGGGGLPEEGDEEGYEEEEESESEETEEESPEESSVEEASGSGGILGAIEDLFGFNGGDSTDSFMSIDTIKDPKNKWIVLGVVTLIAIAAYFYFKNKK